MSTASSVLGVAAPSAGEFHAFSLVHAAALVVFSLLTAAAVLLRRNRRGAASGRRIDVAIGLAGLGAALVVNVWWLRPAKFTWGESLPLQLCDLAALAAPFALLTSHRRLRALAYFWGFGLCTQGLVTPVVRLGPAFGEFWMAWLNHGFITGLAIYDVAARGYRPAWSDWRFAMSATTAFFFVVLPIDVAFGFNYGYVGSTTPGATTLLDLLGAWPLRIVWIILLATLAMAATMLPWELARVIGAGTQRRQTIR